MLRDKSFTGYISPESRADWVKTIKPLLVTWPDTAHWIKCASNHEYCPIFPGDTKIKAIRSEGICIACFSTKGGMCRKHLQNCCKNGIYLHKGVQKLQFCNCKLGIERGRVELTKNEMLEARARKIIAGRWQAAERAFISLLIGIIAGCGIVWLSRI